MSARIGIKTRHKCFSGISGEATRGCNAQRQHLQQTWERQVAKSVTVLRLVRFASVLDIPYLVVCNGSVYIALSLSPRFAVTHASGEINPVKVDLVPVFVTNRGTNVTGDTKSISIFIVTRHSLSSY